MKQQNEIIIFGYEASPYFQKVLSFLTFLDLQYSICEQPRTLPRPDFQSIGLKYRRIPVLSIDGEIYADSSIICETLCRLSSSSLSIITELSPNATTSTGKESERMKEIENKREYEVLGREMFACSVGLLPPSLPIMQDPVFLADRTELSGRVFSPSAFARGRMNALSTFCAYLSILERRLSRTGSLHGYQTGGNQEMAKGDGQGKGEGTRIGTGDLHVYFVVKWVIEFHRGSEPEVTRQKYPNVYSWLRVVKQVLDSRSSKTPKTVAFEEIKASLLWSGVDLEKKMFQEMEARHDYENPLGLKVGQAVSIVPMDSGRNHPQAGCLLYLNDQEVCVSSPSAKGEARIIVHFPRINFSVTKVDASRL